MESLRKEQIIVRQRIKEHENILRMKMYEIPAELAAAGANTLIPRMLRGKITNTVLNTGKRLINNFIVPEDRQNPNLLTHTVKNRGVFSLLKKGIGLFIGKK
jgi:hypothetical protein